MSHEQFVNGLAPWAAQYDTCLLIKLLQKGVVFPVGSGLLPWEAPVMIAESVIYSFSFLFFSVLLLTAWWCVQGTRRFGSEESEPIDWIVAPKSESKSGSMTQPGLSEMFAYHATTMANTISTSLVVFSRKVCSCQMLKSTGMLTRYSATGAVMCLCL